MVPITRLPPTLHSPSVLTLFILPQQRSSTATPFHGCASTVAHLSRPIDVFVALAITTSSSFPMSSYSPATSDPGIEPVLVSEPLVLRRMPFISFRRQNPSHAPRGSDERYAPATVFSRTIRLTKVWLPLDVVNNYIRTQFSLLTDTRPRLLDGRSIHSLFTDQWVP